MPIPLPNRGSFKAETIIAVFLFIIVVIVLLTSWVSAKRLSRDKERVSDITQIQEGLKLYFAQNGYYPTGQGLDSPKGLDVYLDHWPVAPTPVDGSCKLAQNEYNYSQKARGLDFVLTFCLGQDLDGLVAGSHTVTAKGIQ